MKASIIWIVSAFQFYLLPIQAGDPYLSELIGKKFIDKLKESLPEFKNAYDAGAFTYPKSVSIGEMLSGVQYLKDWSIRSTQGHDIATVFLLDTNSASYSWARHIPSSARSYEVKPLTGTVGIRQESKPKVFKVGVIACDSISTKILIEIANRTNFAAILDSVKLRMLESGLKK